MLIPLGNLDVAPGTHLLANRARCETIRGAGGLIEIAKGGSRPLPRPNRGRGEGSCGSGDHYRRGSFMYSPLFARKLRLGTALPALSLILSFSCASPAAAQDSTQPTATPT